MLKNTLALVGLTFSLSVNAAITIDFENFSHGNFISTVSGATFSSSSGGIKVLDFDGEFAASGQNVIGVDGNLSAALSVSFDTGVDMLSFYTGGDDNIEHGFVYIYVGGIFDSSIVLTGDGINSTAHLQDLSAFSNVTEILIVPDDPAGLVYDDFSFSPSAVPIPAAAWLFGSALLGLVGIKRRK